MENTPHLTTGIADPVMARCIRITPPGMATWAATGPLGTKCATCAHYGYTTPKLDREGRPTGRRHVYWTRCGKYRRLTGRRGAPIPPETESCHFYLHAPTTE